MNNLKFLFLICFGLSFFPAFAAKVKIEGSSMAYKGQEAELIVFEDYFSLKEKTIATSMIDKEGKFLLEADVPAIQKSMVRIGNVATSLYLEPGNHYKLNIPGLPLGKEVQGNLNFVPHQMLYSAPGKLNGLVLEFNDRYDRFIEENYPLIITKAARRKIEEFKIKERKEAEGKKHSFFSQFVEYSLASLSQLGMASRVSLYKEFLKGKPVLPHNPEYVAFIKSFFDNHLLALSSSKGLSVANAIDNRNLEGLVSIYKTDSMLGGHQLRELVILRGLQEAAVNKAYKKTSVVYLLKEISSKSIFPAHRTIAENIIWSVTRFDPGQKAPAFELLGQNGESLSLADFKGKYVYLNFWATWCTTCIHDMALIKSLHEKYQQNIVFLSVSTDRSQTDYLNYLKKYPYRWHFAHFSTDRGIIDSYAARGLPLYYLISPDGRFVDAPALAPSENIEKRFREILAPLEKKPRIGERN